MFEVAPLELMNKILNYLILMTTLVLRLFSQSDGSCRYYLSPLRLVVEPDCFFHARLLVLPDIVW